MTQKALHAAIRAAKLALFVIEKQGVMPNASWEAGFNSDLAVAEAGISASDRADWNMCMDEAPRDGTVIEAVGRYLGATAGFPRYVMFRDGAWFDCSRHAAVEVICWAWRHRTGWPLEQAKP